MKKLWVIIQREYLSRVKKRSFIITTLLVPILIAGFYAAIIFVAVGNNGGKQKNIAVVDESTFFIQKLSNSKTIQFSYPQESFEELKNNLSKTKFDGILYIPPIDIYKVNDNIKFYSNEQIGPGAKQYILGELKDRVKQLRMIDKEISKDLLRSLNVDMTLPELGVSQEDQDKRAGSELLSTMGLVMAMMLYFILIMFGTMVMRGVKEEKTNRIVEIVMSSVKPFQLMFGKIIGISLVGMTQFIIWGVIIYIAQIGLTTFAVTQLDLDPSVLSSSSGASMDSADLEGVEKLLVTLKSFNYTSLIITFIFYFLGGYFIYASLFSAVGSVVEDDNESQQLVFPVMLPILLSVGIVTSIMDDPNNPIAKWASIFPLTSPIVMPARMPFNPPMWEIVASVVCLIAGVIFFIWLSAKVYRIGILMYGKKVNFKEIWKWLRYS